ncbi:MAG: YicC family protein [Bacteroidales bacterium]|jgi:uncharacterized protein (TIGR00255 family)|nr:YicC family protein [Bacteroidales bacterium]
MIKSMTGYGRSIVNFGAKTITIEIKSVNSKQFDLSLRLPSLYREKELEIRTMISSVIERGKTDILIAIESSMEGESYMLNQSLAGRYYKDLKQLSETIGEGSSDQYLSIIARLPDVFKSTSEMLDEDEWTAVSTSISETLKKIDVFRINEGDVLQSDFSFRVNAILELLNKIAPFEKERTQCIRLKLLNAFNDIEKNNEIDKNRFEQELIYYLEKFDITEEKIRLRKHCEYFLETMNEVGASGKKLGFISQEMGREINTLGSKANYFEMQRIVVLMKDELEKIKEQLLNIL